MDGNARAVYEKRFRKIRGLMKRGQVTEARRVLCKHLRDHPNDLRAHMIVLQIDLDRQDLDAAERNLRALLPRWPHLPDLYVNLGYVRKLKGDLPAAVALWEEALNVSPGYVPALGNLANAAYHDGDLARVDALAGMAMAADPTDGVSRLNQGFADLLRGRWESGWRLYEYRWHMSGHTRWNPQPPQPWWDGSPVGTLCVWHEQGVGDAIQMWRYDRVIREAGTGRVIWTLPERLVPLAVAGGLEAVSKRTTPEADAYVALMSLPYVFGTRPETVPSAPYLTLREAA